MTFNFNIKVISLERSKKRRKEFSKQNSHIDFEFFNGIDGQSLPSEVFYDEKFFIQPLDFLTRGAYGCALSHITLWDKVIETNTPITIVEDDAIFRKDFYEQANKIIKTIPFDYDLIHWGVNIDSIMSLDIMPNIAPVFCRFSQNSFKDNIYSFINDTTPCYPHKLFYSSGIPAYTLSVKGATFLKQKCLPLQSFYNQFPVVTFTTLDVEEIEVLEQRNEGIDTAMGRYYHSSNSFVSLPLLVLSLNNKYISDVHTLNKKNKPLHLNLKDIETVKIKRMKL